MSHALPSGLPRVYKSHHNRRGRWYREHFLALADRLGPFDALTRVYAAGVAACWCEYQADELALEASEALRRDGKGRRPSAQTVARLKKRRALSWGSYDAALRRLEELSAGQKAKGDPLAALRLAVSKANP